MKRTLLSAALLLLTMQLHAQVLLADTAFTTDVGHGGAPASSICKPNGGSYGFDMEATDQSSMAEDFTVPAGQIWRLDSITVYGYQTGSTTRSPFTSAYVQVNRDSVTGASVVGNFTQNRLGGTGWTGIYRVDTANGHTQDTLRPVMYLNLVLSPAPELLPGRYWMAWSAHATFGGISLCPPKVVPDRSNPPGQNAMRRVIASWMPVLDSNAPGNAVSMGFNFMLHGAARAGTAVSTVPAGDNGLQVMTDPSRQQCHISFMLAQAGPVSLSLRDMTGRLVAALLDGRQQSGLHTAHCDLNELPAGSYYCVLRTDTMQQIRIVQVLR